MRGFRLAVTWCPSGELNSCETLSCVVNILSPGTTGHNNTCETTRSKITHRQSKYDQPWQVCEGTKRLPRPWADLFTGYDSVNPHLTMYHIKPSKERHWLCNHSVNTCLIYQSHKEHNIVYLTDQSAKAEKS